MKNRIKSYHPEAWQAYLADEELRNSPLPDFIPVDASLPEPVLSPWFSFEEITAQAKQEVQQILARSRRREARRRKRKSLNQ